MTTCIIDTCVLLHYLDVPGRNERRAEVVTEFHRKVAANENFVLPVAAIIETGNFIGGLGDRDVRGHIASRLAALIQQSITNQAPFKLFPALGPHELADLLPKFSDWTRAHRSGLADLTIREVFNLHCGLEKRARVYIWTLDGHLMGFDRPA